MERVFRDINDGISTSQALKHTINKEPADWYLGVKLVQHCSGNVLHSVDLTQQSYIEQICKANGITGGKAVKTSASQVKLTKLDSIENPNSAEIAKQQKFRSNVGALLFLARCTMPTIAYAVGALGRFSSDSGPPHWAEMEHLLKHIYSIRTMGLRYTYNRDDPDSVIATSIVCNWNKYVVDDYFIAYTDSDFAGCPDTSRSTSGNVLIWMGAAVSWASALQACVTLSTAEAEMVALSKASQEVIWFRRLMQDLGHASKIPTPIYCDNQATLRLIKHRVHHSRTKHIELRKNFTKEHVETEELNPQYIVSADNLADCFTKPIKLSIIEQHFQFITGMPLTYSQ